MLGDASWEEDRLETHVGKSTLVDEELLEVPANIVVVEHVVHQLVLLPELSHRSWTGSPEVLIQRRRSRPIDFNLLEELKSWNESAARPHVGEAVVNLSRVRTRFLEGELIAWKTKNDQITGILLLQRI